MQLKNFNHFRLVALLILQLFQNLFSQQSYQVSLSTTSELFINVNINPESHQDIKPFDILVGLPDNTLPKIEIKKYEEKGHNYKIVQSNLKTGWSYNQKINDLNTATLTINPATERQTYFKSITIKVFFDSKAPIKSNYSARHEYLLAPKIINWNVAKKWVRPKYSNKESNNNPPEGRWIRFSISKDDIYRIDGELINSKLSEVGASLNFDPRSIMLFSSQSFGRDKTFDLTQKLVSETSVPTNLSQIPLTIIGESDGNLSNQDYLFFYARGPSGFNIENNNVKWHQNLYFTKSEYWLLIPNDSSIRGKRIATDNIIEDGPLQLGFGLTYRHYEIDKINPQESGLAWGNQIISTGASYIEEIELDHPLQNTSGNATFGMIGNEKLSTRYKNTNHRIRVSKDGANLSNVSWSNIGMKSSSFSIPSELIQKGLNKFMFTNESENINSEPFFDFLTLSYHRELIYDGTFEFFSTLQSSDATYNIAGKDLIVWNISKKYKPVNIPVLSSDNTYFRVSIPPDTLQRFVVFKSSNIEKVEDLSIVNDKKWDILRSKNNSADHIFIGPEAFKEAVNRLLSHRGKSIYASLENIYNEFSGGNKDPIAIRYFLNWAQNFWSTPPLTVLFLGDADYDYRNITGQSKLITPTIQIGTLNTYSSDDRLVAFNGKIPEMASGRFPARNEEEVRNFSDKIVEFETNMQQGLWTQKITLVADDPLRPEKEAFELSTGKSHTLNSEKIFKLIPDYVEVDKLYLVDFPDSNDGTPFGVTKPDATQRLFDIINKGTSIINYIGHGNSTQWAQEKLLLINDKRDDIESIKTNMKLPIWIAGTCNWGHFDSINNESFAEQLIRTPMDGASAVISTTRGISVTGNIQFLLRLFNKIFEDEESSSVELGSILQSVKNGSSESELFHLFGDPAMKITLPHNVINDAIVSPDTISTLEVGTLSLNSPMENGLGNFVLQDPNKEKEVSFFYGSKMETISFQEKGSDLFKGKFTFTSAQIESHFRIPKDASFSSNPAKIRFNIKSTKSDDYIGSVSNIFFKPGPPSIDIKGPLIVFETEKGRILRNGDHINQNTTVIIRISDPNGINITGKKGHEIKIKDLVSNEESDISQLFKYDINSITSGTYNYKHSDNQSSINLHVHAWDNANNPTESSIQLSLVEDNLLTLKNVLNYPNPFIESTQFTFELTSAAEVEIMIYTLGGLRVYTIGSNYFEQGYNRVSWDGRDSYGQLLSNGAYIYQIKAKNDLTKVNHIGRLAIIR